MQALLDAEKEQRHKSLRTERALQRPDYSPLTPVSNSRTVGEQTCCFTLPSVASVRAAPGS